MADMCADNRFELIERFKKELIESTNIETSPEEIKVIDDILFRFWQMGWLDSIDRMPLVKESAKTLIHSVGNSVSAKAFRNAGRFIQNAIDGEAQEFEFVQVSLEIPNNSDAISRQAAIDALMNINDIARPISAADNMYLIDRAEAMKELMRLPSTEPKTGRWIRWKEQDKQDLANGNALYECSNCGHTDLQAEVLEVPYCWYCGARMEGKKNANND